MRTMLSILLALIITLPADAATINCRTAGTPCIATTGAVAQAGYYYPSLYIASTTGGSAISANTVYLHNYYPVADLTVSRLAVQVTTLGSTSAVKMALYDGPCAAGRIRLTDANPTGADTTSTGGKEVTLSSTVDIKRGSVYCFATIGTGTLHRFQGVQAVVGNVAYQVGGYSALTELITTHLNGWTFSGTYSSGFPDTLPALTENTSGSLLPFGFVRNN